MAGALYVLRCPIAELLTDCGDGRVTGVRTAAGQTLTCGAFAGNVESFGAFGTRQQTSASTSSSGTGSGASETVSAAVVHRAIAITDGSISEARETRPEQAWLLVYF